MVIDDSELIQQVQGFPALYNKKHKLFKDKNAKEQAWIAIGAILGFPAEACEQRWVVLRAKYTKLKKEIREMPSGSGAYNIQWPYFDIMRFLDSFLVTRRTVSNVMRKPQAAECSSLQREESRAQTPISTESQMFGAWDTMAQIVESPAETSPTETEDIIIQQTDSSISETPSSRPSSSQGSGFTQKMKAMRMGVQGSGKVKKASKPHEVMCASITQAVEAFNAKKKTNEDKNGNLAWAKSLAADMEVLTNEERFKFKCQTYSFLLKIMEDRKDINK